jgi:diguanylate cyclase (GGDEF)-like protein
VKINARVNKNLIAISLISTLLIFWLSASFWLEAYTQRSGAAQLQRSTQPEDTLFRLAMTLGKERSLLHTILAERHPAAETLDSLYDVSLQSKELMTNAVNEIRESRQTESARIRHQYDEQTIEKQLSDLMASFEALSQNSSLIVLQAAIAPSERDDAMRMQVFDSYGTLIQQVNNLRLRTHFLPQKNYQEVIASHSIKNAIWDLNESVRQIGALLDGYLIKSRDGLFSSVKRDVLLFRIYQQIQTADHALFEAASFSDRAVDKTGLENQLSEFTRNFHEIYRVLETKLVEDLTEGNYSEINLDQWRLVADATRRDIQLLATESVNRTIETARDIEHTAIRNLALDTLLVLLCIGMAVCSTGIAKKVQYQARHDDLTQLPNRRFFKQHVLESISKSQANTKLALLTIDLNRFKAINDTLGHAVGDSLLRQVAERLQGCADNRMCVARMGGDEFAMLFPPEDDVEAVRLSENILRELERSFDIDGGMVNIGTSIGISYYPEDAKNAEDLQVTSDYAMFFAKRDGKKERKSCIQLYNREMAEEFDNRMKIERDLATAIEENQFELYYQPQFNLDANCVDACEALLRWKHPTRGMVSPFEFISVAEDCGLMPAVGKWVLNEACRQAAEWQHKTDIMLRVAINVSVQQIMQPGFVNDVLSTMAHYKLHSDRIEIELTESVFMADTDWVVKSLLQLREAGIKIALDDFGTGYSSLSQLQDLPVNTLKIDRSFISKLSNSPGVSNSVTATIASIADVLGLETVAEGVESDEQLDQVADLGINVVQGFFYSKPVASPDIPAAINKLNNEYGSQPGKKAA